MHSLRNKECRKGVGVCVCVTEVENEIAVRIHECHEEIKRQFGKSGSEIGAGKCEMKLKQVQQK